MVESSGKDSLRVLIVDDSEADVVLEVRALRKYFGAVEYQQVDGGETMRAALTAHRWDVILSDWSIPGFGGEEALAMAQTLACETPFLVVSGMAGEELAIAAMRTGLHGCVLKHTLGGLGAAVERELRAHRAPHRYASSKQRFDAVSDLICVVGFDGYFRRANAAWQRTLAWTIDELIALHWIELVHPADRGAMVELTRQIFTERVDVVRFENRYRSRDGEHRMLLWSAAPVHSEQVVYAAAVDVSQRTGQ